MRLPGLVWGQGFARQGEALHAGATRWSRLWVLSDAAMLRPLVTTMRAALWGVIGVCESPRGQLRSAGGGQGQLQWCQAQRAAGTAPGVPDAGTGAGWRHRALG